MSYVQGDTGRFDLPENARSGRHKFALRNIFFVLTLLGCWFGVMARYGFSHTIDLILGSICAIVVVGWAAFLLAVVFHTAAPMSATKRRRFRLALVATIGVSLVLLVTYACLNSVESKLIYLRQGMTEQEVLAILGEPTQRDGNSWRYPGGLHDPFWLYFDANRRLDLAF